MGALSVAAGSVCLSGSIGKCDRGATQSVFGAQNADRERPVGFGSRIERSQAARMVCRSVGSAALSVDCREAEPPFGESLVFSKPNTRF